VADQGDLILLIFAVTLVDARCCGESVTLAGHALNIDDAGWRCARLLPLKHVLLSEPDRSGMQAAADSLDSNLHSPERRLIELRMEHADLDAMIDRASLESPVDELMMRRLKKRRLALRDQIARLELVLDPKEPA
jgi:hypothetical protein